jgi:hypothetical protein
MLASLGVGLRQDLKLPQRSLDSGSFISARGRLDLSPPVVAVAVGSAGKRADMGQGVDLPASDDHRFAGVPLAKIAGLRGLSRRPTRARATPDLTSN